MTLEINVGELFLRVADRLGDRECLISPQRRLSFRAVGERCRRLARVLHDAGLGVRRERSELQPWESGQDSVGLYLYNGSEYLEGMLGAFQARAAPFNVNYHYVEDELLYLFRDAGVRAIVYHGSLAPRLRKVVRSLEHCELLLQVADESGEPLLPGAIDYESALAAASLDPLPVQPSPDDLYMLYTGGTTGMPKAVLWRQADAFVAAFSGQSLVASDLSSMDAAVARAELRPRPLTILPAPPFMHAAAQWTAMGCFFLGNPLVIQGRPQKLDPHELWSAVERERVELLLIVGDAFAVPLLEQLSGQRYDLACLKLIVNGGAALNEANKRAFLERLPGVQLLDSLGSSETGQQGQNLSATAQGATTGSFQPNPGTCVLSPDLKRVLEAGDEELGWLARSGRTPQGYLGDREKTERTFPVIGGVRYSVPGDRARVTSEGVIELAGRDAVTINSGGEKIFAEEVEHALRAHPSVYDAIVVGRPSPRWGQEVVALVTLRPGASATETELRESCRTKLARYKIPKAIFFLDHIVRSPSGKADYRWARKQV